MAATQKIGNWGNSLAVRIPREVAERSGLKAGDTVAVDAAAAGKLTVVRKRPQYRIQDLVKKMTPKNRHELIDWGPPRGKEFW